MLYNQLEGILQPFFLSRGGEALGSLDNIQTYINLAIQDFYNENINTYKMHNETIDTFQEQDGKILFVTQFGIDMIAEISDQDGNNLYPTISAIHENKNDYKKLFNYHEKNIFFHADTDVTKIYITYRKMYEWYNRTEDGKKVIPVPNKAIPAILKAVYDYASPINLFEGEQNQVDFFGHYNNRVNKLESNDGLTEQIQFIPYNEYYD